MPTKDRTKACSFGLSHCRVADCSRVVAPCRAPRIEALAPVATSICWELESGAILRHSTGVSLRTGHGKGAGSPHIEVMPPDELPFPVTNGQSVAIEPTLDRDSHGHFSSEGARLAGQRSGATRRKAIRLIDSLGLSRIAADNTFTPYRDAAEEFVEHHRGALAAQAGGQLGPAPSTMVASAGLQLAASRWAFDQGAAKNDATLIKLGSSLANDSRQNLLAAYELAVREAQARKENAPTAPHVLLAEGLEAGDGVSSASTTKEG